MKKFLTQLVDFDLTLYEVHDKNYDPVNSIMDFWSTYDIKSFRDHTQELLIVYNGNPENNKLQFDVERMQEFIIALTKLCMAYHIAHDSNIDLGEIDTSKFVKCKITQHELEISKNIYDFFNRNHKTDHKC